jgi:acetoin utilization protein AcuB
MYVGTVMRTNLVTVSPQTSLVAAKKIIEEKRISHLLVVNDKGKLVGIISDRDLKQNWASPATSLSAHELNYLLDKVEVSMIMIKMVVTIPTSTTIERAAYIMQQNRINALPVMENDQLAGIITSTDVMGVLLQAIGMSDDSTRITVFVKDGPGKLAEVATTLRDEGINILSLISAPEPDYPGIVELVFRVAGTDGDKAVNALQDKGFKVKTSYTKDISEFLPS